MSGERNARALATIAAQARRTNLVRAAELQTTLERAATEGLDRAEWAAAERIAHQLAGSAGTFGFDGVTELARSLEQILADAAHQESPERLAEARRLVEQATEQLSPAQGGSPETTPAEWPGSSA